MRLDSARNAKAEILQEAYGFVEHGMTAARNTPLYGVDPQDIEEQVGTRAAPLFRAKSLAAATPGPFPATEINARLAPPVAIGIRPGAGDRSTLLLLGTDRRLARHPVVENALRLAKGEAEFIWTGANRRLSCWTPAQRRPLSPGLSIGHKNVSAGTLGGFVDIGGGRIGILSNNHVLADVNRGAAGDAVLQPARRDGGTLADMCGALHSFVPLDGAPGAINMVDCAICAICDGIAPSWALLAELAGMAVPAPVGAAQEDPFVGDALYKIGRTTGLTRGEVFAIEVDNYIVNMGTTMRPFFCRFDNQIQVYSPDSDFARPGDSGSLVIDDEGHVQGLLFAGSTSGGPNGHALATVNPIREVLSQLNARLWI